MKGRVKMGTSQSTAAWVLAAAGGGGTHQKLMFEMRLSAEAVLSSTAGSAGGMGASTAPPTGFGASLAAPLPPLP